MAAPPPEDVLHAGWCDASIGDLLSHQPELVTQWAFVLVTCLDSARDLSTAYIGLEVVRRFPRCEFLGRGLLVPGPLFQEADRALGLFNSFDEVWCYASRPEMEKPGDASVLPDPSLDDDAPTAATVEWMHASRCTLALGDGFGLNYLTPDARLAAAVRDACDRL